jgi:hypothetical protein
MQLSPNFQTTQDPGFGTIVVEITNLNLPGQVDTIYFQGTTVWTGLNETAVSAMVLKSNIVSDRLEIQNNLRTPCNADILNMNGTLISEKIIATGSSSIDVSGLEPGIYYLRAKFQAGLLLKFIVVH